jgi:ATP-binding cassette subfamily F protein uup
VNLLRLTDAEIAYGGRKLLDQASLTLQTGEKIALIGRNGAGKSTLLKILAGTTQLDDGTRWTADNLTVATLSQTVPEVEDQTIYHTVVEGLGELGELLDRYHAIAQQSSMQHLEQLSEVEAGIESLGGWNVEQRVNRVLQRMALPADALMKECSGGLQRRAMLARALVAEPDLLLLDEPTNHLDIPTIDALQSMLIATPATVVLVTHDRTLIDAVATRIVEVDRGALSSYPGRYATYLDRKARAAEAEAQTDRKFDQELAREETWIRQGIKARRTRNEGRVRRLGDLRKQRAARQQQQGNVRLAIDQSQQSGNQVAVLDDVSFSYGSEAPLIRNFSTRIMRGDRVGIIGANGSGKSTLLRLILGELQPSHGTVTLGTRLKTAYFDQQRSRLDDRLTVRESVGEGSDTIVIGDRSKHVVGYLQDFLFPPSQLNMPVASLSGGEKNRLLMAKLFAQPANLLVLDEPTNDLDVDTLELLEELLGEFAGTLLLVSHDRTFLDAIVTSTIVFEPDGSVREYVGGYSDWQRQTGVTEQTADTSSTPPSTQEASKRSNKDNRLGYKDKRELEGLPDQIESLEVAQSALQDRISEPGFYQQEQAEVQSVLDELNELTRTVEAAYQRWEVLAAGDD